MTFRSPLGITCVRRSCTVHTLLYIVGQFFSFILVLFFDYLLRHQLAIAAACWNIIFFLRRIPSRVTHRVPHTKHSTSAESLCIDAISLSLLLRRYRRDICYRFFCSPFFLSAFIQLLSLYFVALCRLLCMCPCVRKLWPLIMKTECRVYNMHICSQESLS